VETADFDQKLFFLIFLIDFFISFC
jgi:hypothetical protein